MGKFESYESANNLTDNDITLYNKDKVTYKVTFGTLANLIASKIHSISSITAGAGLLGGTITSSGTIKCNLNSENLSSLTSTPMGSTPDRQYAVGLDKNGKLSVNIPWAGSTYTANNGVKIEPSNNVISANLKSNVKSSLTATSMGNTANRQYAVGLDVNGNLSVNVPWKSYLAGTGLDLVSNGTTFVVNIKDDIPSVYYSTTRTDMANREYPVGIDADGYLSVNVPWVSGSGGDVMFIDGSNASSEVVFNGSFTVGSRPNDSVVGTNSVVEGIQCVASGNYSHAEGQTTKALVSYSHAEGYNTEATIMSSAGIVTANHAEGCGSSKTTTGISDLPTTFNTNATCGISSGGHGSHAEGYVHDQVTYTGVIQANGHGAHAEGHANANSNGGSYIIASGNGAHAEGYSSYGHNTFAQGSGAHSEGWGNWANGHAVHAEGYNNTVNGSYSHAEGADNTIGGGAAYCHAEGQSNSFGTTIRWAHVEGYSNKCEGFSSHAEGHANIASGYGSHVEGENNTAKGNYSHVGGYGISYNDGANPSRFIHGGYNNKFGDSSCGRGAIGFHPDGHYCSSDTTFTVEECKYGLGGTVAADATITLTLDVCAIYQLYITAKDSGGIMVAVIATASTSSGTPRIEELTPTSYASIGSNNKLIINDTSQLLFHLIRII